MRQVYSRALRQMICTDSRAHHSAYFGKTALEAARGATFVEIPRFSLVSSDLHTTKSFKTL
ncbi:hypothetical protein JHK87_022433 [Glycine soja]|nr:hypothetical protein JHK87_022433 [Glycine soja]